MKGLKCSSLPLELPTWSVWRQRGISCLLSLQPVGSGMQWCPCPAGEGPVGLIVCPSRELARQTHEVIDGYTNELKAREGKQLNTLLCIGGIDTKAQTDK